MVEQEQYGPTQVWDYGFGIAHFVERLEQQRPARIFSRFELLDSPQLGLFKAHVEYAYVQGCEVHRCDIFGSESVLSAQPQALTDSLSSLGVVEVEGDVRVDTDSGAVYQRFIPDDCADQAAVSESLDLWGRTVLGASGSEGIRLMLCRARDHIYVDAAVGLAHFIGIIAERRAHLLQQILTRHELQVSETHDYTEVAQWLAYATACPVG